MLKLWTYTTRQQIEQKCEQVDFQNETWILPDLRSKIQLQKQLFSKYGYTLENFVMRASDLWKTLLRKSMPEYEVVSRDYAGLLAKGFLKELPPEDPLFVGLTESTWLDQLNRWSAVAFSESMQDELTQYLELNPDLKGRIVQDFYFARILALFFAKKKKTTALWIPALLQDQTNLPQLWNRALWIDLRGEISLSEAELFQRFSHLVDVNVLVPESPFEKDYPGILKIYDYLRSKANAISALGRVGNGTTMTISKTQKVYGFSGPLAEVKSAVAQVRVWLDQGVYPQEIGLLAPEIENYWPCLSSYLQIEGIPAQKAVVSRLMTFPSVRLWMARLHSSMNVKDYFSLEKAHFSRAQIRLEEFRALLYEIYEDRDLMRIQSVFAEIQRTPAWPARMTRDEFLGRSLNLLEVDQSSLTLPPEIKKALEKFLREASASDEASPADWFKFLESMMGQTEIQIREADESGIVVSSLMSAWSSGLKKIIFLGISDEGLKSYSRLGLSPVDTRQLSQDLGLVIESAEKNIKEYELRWWLTETETDPEVKTEVGIATKAEVVREIEKEIEIYEPLTDWQGQLLNHTALLLDREKLQKNVKTATRWDQIQSLGLKESLKFDLPLNAVSVDRKVQEDLGFQKMRPISGWTLKELSPSSIESYLKCPFVFFANKGFRLLDMDEIDLDLDVRQSGQFYHAVADALLDPTRRLVWSEVELMELIEDLKNKHFIISQTDPTWEPRKAKIVKWSQHFLDFEKDWLSTYPATQVFGRETSWKSPWGSDIVFRGKIDRLDINAEGQAVLIDYKSSTAGKAGPRSWLANNDLQLLFYIWALRSGGVSDFRGEIVGAFYYDLKKFDRSKGLHLRQESTLLASLVRKNAGISPEELEEFMLEFEKKIDQTLFRMNQGCYQPEPEDQKDCQKCRWNQICRAPHLN